MPMGLIDRSLTKTKLAIDRARRELLDPSRRNRLLHAPLAGKRPWCMEIVGHDPDDLFETLCRQENLRGYAFNPTGEEQEQGNLSDRGAAASGLYSTRRTSPTVSTRRPRVDSDTANGAGIRPRLQTKLSAEKLEKRLTKIFREVRTLEEEQGVSTLYLALGFLKWFDNDQSEEPSFAPLILTPVTIARVRGSDGYALTGRDEEINTNISLREKLRSEFGITLPDIPEGEHWTPSEYAAAVSAEIARYKRWEVKSDYVGLGFFTFSKFMMWRDLDAAVWPQSGLLARPLLNALLDENHELQDAGPITNSEESIDHRVDISKAVHVVDADSSQAIVIEEALRGRNLVVQGPPGTGKSQTIANIIAAAVHSGKSVLFVAEKTAALSVVHDRLSRAGLSALCLEMHSRKANKRDVLKSLEEALCLSGNFVAETGARLAACRDSLNEWSHLVHRPIGQTRRTAFEVMGRQLNLRAEKICLLPDRLDVAAQWQEERLLETEAALDRAVATIAKLGIAPAQHVWHGAKLGVQSPFDLERLTASLDNAVATLDQLSTQLSKVYPHLVGVGAPCMVDGFALVTAFRHLRTAPELTRSALVGSAWTGELKKLLDAIHSGERFARTAAEIDFSIPTTSVEFGYCIHLAQFSARGKVGLSHGSRAVTAKRPRHCERRVARSRRGASANELR